MDEPTNDLDAETLDLLEDLLVEYNGTLLLVSHDREFLDNVVTSTFVFEGNGVIGDYVGGYQDWLRQKSLPKPAVSTTKEIKEVKAEKKPSTSRKLTNKEQKELESLPASIEALEKEQASIAAQLADPAFYQKEPALFNKAREKLEQIEQDHARAFSRWEELEALRKG